jgi:hypothetical protein
MNYHHKYQKKGQYLLHPDLIEFRRGGWWFQIKFNTVVLLILGTMKIYPTSLMSFDITMAVLVIGFWMIGRNIMLKGMLPVKTYYKRGYENDNFLFFCKMIIHGSVVRALVISIFYAFNLYLATGDRYEGQDVQRHIMHILINPIPQAIAVAVFLFLFYYMFYKEKYISIEGFSKEVMKIVRSGNKPINDAVRQFIYVRDLALEKELLDGVKYEHTEESHSEMVKDNGQKRKSNESLPKEEPPMLLRRQSRR